MVPLTIEEVANSIVEKHESAALNYIHTRPSLYYAKFSTGAYGRIWAPFIKSVVPNIDLNGYSTDIGLAVTQKLESRGYSWQYRKGLDRVLFDRTDS